MKYGLTRPCKECPFREKSMRGWLGGESAQTVANNVSGMRNFHGIMIGGEPGDYACHMDVARQEKKLGRQVELDEINHCAGALHFLRTSCKEPNDKEKREAIDKVKQTPGMIRHYQDFVKHHTPFAKP